MNKYLIMTLAIALLAGCASKTDGFVVEGTLNGEVADGTAVYLKISNEKNQPVDVDTTSVADGKYSFTGVQNSPEVGYIFIEHIRGNIPFIIENGDISISAQKDSLNFAEVKGTYQNEIFADYMDESRRFSSKAQTMNRDMREAAAMRDTAVMNSLREEYFELQDNAKALEVTFAKEHPDALIAALILSKFQATKTVSDAEIQEMFDALSPEIKETTAGKSVKEKLESGAKTAIGQTAPNFSAPTPGGQELALNEVLGKATILDFWAAWCKPCRVENPNVVRIYNKYKESGLSILGVSLDRRAEDWKKAIADDGLEWHHVSNVQYFDEIAKLYNVNAIPATFILDENGVIVAKNLRGQALEDKIAEMLQ